MVYTQVLSTTTVFNIDNNTKCFLSSTDHVIWRLSNDAENSDLRHILQYIQTEKGYLKF